jgi:anti-sigma factor RsiW
MSCDSDALESFVLGELSTAAAAQVAAHARACAHCADEIQWLRREQIAVMAYARSSMAELPAFDAVLGRSCEEAPAGQPTAAPRSWVAGLATAAALMLALGASLHLRPSGAVRASAAWGGEGDEIASSEPGFSLDTSEEEAIAGEEARYEACLWASPGAPVVDVCL